MRITDPQVILNGEKDLIASVQRDLDLDAVRDLLKERLTVTALSPKGGRIVVHDNEVAFRLDYEINLNGSLLFNRNGDLLEDSDGTAPEQERYDEDTVSESDPDQDQDLSINLPDYDDVSSREPEGLQAEPGLEIEDLEDESAFDQQDSDLLEADDSDELDDDEPENLTSEELPDITLKDDDNQSGQDMGEDDISDILQESRDFWEKKKE